MIIWAERGSITTMTESGKSSGKTIRSVSIAHPYITHACVTSNEEFGYGVYSWHTNIRQARRNAGRTRGMAVPVIREANGEYRTPAEAKIAVNRFLETSMEW